MICVLTSPVCGKKKMNPIIPIGSTSQRVPNEVWATSLFTEERNLLICYWSQSKYEYEISDASWTL